MGMGVSYKHNNLWVKFLMNPFSAAHRQNWSYHWTWNACKNMTLGGKKSGSFSDMGATNTTTYCAEANYDNGLRVGAKWDFVATNYFKFTDNNCTAYFNYSNAGRTAGVRIDHDEKTGKWATKVGLQLDHEDHTWKFRVHNTGMMHALLKWRLHRTCSAAVNTSINLNDVPKGRIGRIPLGMAFNIEY